MRRHLLTACSAGLLVLCAATCVLWVHSWDHHDTAYLGRWGRPVSVTSAISYVEVYFGHWTVVRVHYAVVFFALLALAVVCSRGRAARGRRGTNEAHHDLMNGAGHRSG